MFFISRFNVKYYMSHYVIVCTTRIINLKKNDQLAFSAVTLLILIQIEIVYESMMII